MLDQPTIAPRAALQGSRPRLDFQDHLADLEANGLLVRIERPINKDTELHPLVRWQFLGGVPEDKRRAFLFTNVTDGKGRRYDIPVVVGALAASPDIYAIGMGQPVAEIGRAWMRAIANPVAPVRPHAPRCQEIVLRGEELAASGGLLRLPVPVSTPGFDSAPYLTATLCITRDPDSGVQNMGTYRAALKASDRLVVRMVAREATGAGGYLHWLKYRQRREPMPIAIVIGCAPIVMFTGPQKLAIDMDELGVAGAVAGAPIEIAKAITVDLDIPASSEIVVEGLIDPERLEPEAPFGESNGYVALEAYNMPMRVTAITHKRSPVFTSIISQVTPSESSVIKKVAYEPLFLDHLRERLGIKGVRRVVMHERLTNLRPVIFLQIAEGTPRSEVWRALHGTAHQSDRGRASGSPPRRRARRPIRTQELGFRHAGRCHPQVSDGAARPADARIHGARASTVGGARPLSPQCAVALARLRPRGLDRPLGDLRAARRQRRLGAKRPRYPCPPARRPAAGDSGSLR
jgi:UbiD family decarboxylase